jgi:hypothetical protein
MTYGIKVSKPSFDVRTCDDKDLVMSSEINTLKTFGSQLLEPNDDPYTHNIGYVPIHLYAGYLSAKPLVIGLVGQNTDDNLTNVVASSTTITNDNNSEWAANALVYVFYDEL